jgi:hypothetical protein
LVLKAVEVFGLLGAGIEVVGDSVSVAIDVVTLSGRGRQSTEGQAINKTI